MVSVIIIVVFVIFIFLSLGIGFIFLDYFVKNKNEFDDWTLIEEWEQKEIKKAIERLKREEKRK